MDKTLTNLGLVKRASKIVIGTDNVILQMRKGNIKLIFLASDTEHNTTKKITDKAKFYNVEVINRYTSEDLDNSLGGNKFHVIGINDSGFAKLLKD